MFAVKIYKTESEEKKTQQNRRHIVFVLEI